MVVPQADAQLKPTSAASISPITFTGRIVQSYFLSTDPTQTPAILPDVFTESILAFFLIW